MTEQFLSTSRLGNVIQLIALGKQTGVLKVIRGLGAAREQGEIHFMNGQPTFASLGQMVGNAALTVLQNWGECQYIFLEGALPLPDRSLFQVDTMGRSGEYFAPPSGGFDPRPGPRYPSPPNRQTGGIPSFTTPLSSNPGPDTGFGGNRNTGNLSYPDSTSLSGPLSPLPKRRDALPAHFIPQRVISIDRLEELPLDRRERVVLLLIDGRRTLTDLVRLTRRSEQEIQAILAHLAALRLIE
jgi:hypothetical protein